MSDRGIAARRGRIFLVAGPLLLGLLAVAFGGLPALGEGGSALGRYANTHSISQVSITAAVTTVYLDYRAYDTLVEEALLFAAVVGVATVLRKAPDEREGEHDDDAPGRRVRETSEGVSLLGLGLVGPTVLVGLYIVAHGHQTPGGGFTGGVILASALVLTYLCDRYRTLRRVGPTAVVEFAEGLGTFAFALIGVVGLVSGGAFMANVLGKGTPGELLSSGLVPFSNAAVGLAVAGGFSLLLTEFLEQTLVLRKRRARTARRRDASP